jgi:hypothetical protein
MNAPVCGLVPVAYSNEFRLEVLEYGISCGITPYADMDGKTQSVLFPEIKADSYEVHFGSDIMYEPTDKIRYSKLIFDIILDEGAYNYESFYNWMVVGKIEPAKAKTTVVISLMNPRTLQPSVSFTYGDVLCVNISPVSFDITNTDVARFTVTLQPSSMTISR